MLWTRSARLLILTVFLGTGLLAMVEDLNVFDAFYLVGMGVSTVGCGDVVPQTPRGRICVIIITICGMVSYIGLIRSIIDILKQHRHPLFTMFVFVLGALNAFHFFFCCYEEDMSFGDSIWFAMTLATGAGFGDVTLKSKEGRLSVVTFAMFFNVLLGWFLWVASDKITAFDSYLVEKWMYLAHGRRPVKLEPDVV